MIVTRNIAIIIDGASGIRETTTRMLAETGARVASFDLSVQRGEDVAAGIVGLFCAFDVTDETSLEAVFAKARSAHGQERILVNFAGIASGKKNARRYKRTGMPVAHSIVAFARTVNINLVGTFICIAKATSRMLSLSTLEDGERGVIINTASVAAENGQIGQAAYAASKAGVKEMTLPIARDLMNEGIRCNVVVPGILGTPMLTGLSQNIQDFFAATLPFTKRFGKLAEYAEAVTFLITNGYMNGALIRLDGALLMAPR